MGANGIDGRIEVSGRSGWSLNHLKIKQLIVGNMTNYLAYALDGVKTSCVKATAVG